MAIILASASAARAKMLGDAGVEIDVRPARIDETTIIESLTAAGVKPRDIADALAEAKALRAAVSAPPGAIVLAADQILSCENRIFEKPGNRAAALAQLQALRGKRHELWSAAAAARDGAVIWRHVEGARLTMRAVSDEFLEDYLGRAGDGVLTSVGAYHLEGLGAQLFSRIEGDYFTVLGLPLLAVLDFLRTQGVLKS